MDQHQRFHNRANKRYLALAFTLIEFFRLSKEFSPIVHPIQKRRLFLVSNEAPF